MIGTFIKTSPYTYMAGVAILLASHGFVYFKGREHGLEQYYQFRANVESQMEALRSENAERVAAMADTAKHAADGWEAARAELARRPTVIRVQPSSCPGEMPGLSAASTSVAGLQASESGLGAARTITVEECEARVNGSISDAIWIETVKQLTSDWHEASK